MKGCKNCKLNPSCTMVWRTSKKDCPHSIQKTNAERIRAMSDEKLAEFLSDFKDCAKDCLVGKGVKDCSEICATSETLRMWLQQPEEEDT